MKLITSAYVTCWGCLVTLGCACPWPFSHLHGLLEHFQSIWVSVLAAQLCIGKNTCVGPAQHTETFCRTAPLEEPTLLPFQLALQQPLSWCQARSWASGFGTSSLDRTGNQLHPAACGRGFSTLAVLLKQDTKAIPGHCGVWQGGLQNRWEIAVRNQGMDSPAWWSELVCVSDYRWKVSGVPGASRQHC